MAKKGKVPPDDQSALESAPMDDPIPEGVPAPEVEIVQEKPSGGVKKSGWRGGPGTQWRGGSRKVKPSELYSAFLKVYRGNLSLADTNNPQIQSVLQLKLEDNAKFLSDLSRLTKEHRELSARKAESLARQAADSKSEVAKDQKTEDLLGMIEELIVECVAASKA